MGLVWLKKNNVLALKTICFPTWERFTKKICWGAHHKKQFLAEFFDYYCLTILISSDISFLFNNT